MGVTQSAGLSLRWLRETFFGAEKDVYKRQIELWGLETTVFLSIRLGYSIQGHSSPGT